MTDVRVLVSGGLPLVELRGAVTEKTGSDLAAKVMAAINHAHDGSTPQPLSLPAPRLLRGA